MPSLGLWISKREKALQRVGPTHLCVLFLSAFSSMVMLGLLQAAPHTHICCFPSKYDAAWVNNKQAPVPALQLIIFLIIRHFFVGQNILKQPLSRKLVRGV